MTIKINCDLGECLTPNIDSEIMPVLDMASIACGGHAGDISSMKQTIALAKKNKVLIGAHPSYEDRENFGRLSIKIPPEKLFRQIFKQVSVLNNLCLELNTKLNYIKPHGALYHDMMKKSMVLTLLIRIIKTFNTRPALIVQAGIKDNYFERISKKHSIRILYEAFADRIYMGKQLIARDKNTAHKNVGLLPSKAKILAQFSQLKKQNTMRIDSICFHSDHKPSVHALKHLIKNQAK